jgi:hypothetical protein
MSSAEFAEWAAFYQVEPFGEVRSDVRSAVVASTIANVHRDPKRRRKPWGLLEFMPLGKVWESEAADHGEGLATELSTDSGNGLNGFGDQVQRTKGRCVAPNSEERKRELYARVRMWATGKRDSHVDSE